MKKLLIAIPLLVCSCGVLGVRENEDGTASIVAEETGEPVPVGTVVGGLVTGATGNPPLGLALGAAATALIAGFLKKRQS